MDIKRNNILILIIYLVAVIAVVNIFSEFINFGEKGNISSKQLKNFIYNLYNFIDKGEYIKLFDLSIEGKWKLETINNKKYYCFNGIVDKNNFLAKAERDFGKKGWRIHFFDIEVVEIDKLNLDDFAKQFPQEYEIIKYIDQENKIKDVNIANIKGYIIGACSIANWEKKLPIIWYEQQWRALLSGTPTSLDNMHREQWLTKINFKVKGYCKLYE